MFLSEEEIFVLTGRPQKSKQCEQLAAQGIPYRTDCDGHPKVLKTLVEKMLGIDDETSSQQTASIDKEALLKLMENKHVAKTKAN